MSHNIGSPVSKTRPCTGQPDKQEDQDGDQATNADILQCGVAASRTLHGVAARVGGLIGRWTRRRRTGGTTAQGCSAIGAKLRAAFIRQTTIRTVHSAQRIECVPRRKAQRARMRTASEERNSLTIRRALETATVLRVVFKDPKGRDARRQ